MEIRLWHELLLPYELAVKEMVIKFKHLKKEHREKELYSPIEQVSGRVKSINSILEKMQRKNISWEELEEKVEDIAGIRIICQFSEDIEKVADIIQERQDMRVLEIKDYITHMKESGYRSYHMIIAYHVETLEGPREIKAEIQIRTLAMNFWATIEHSLQYKYKGNMPPHVRTRLNNAAQSVLTLDEEMSSVRNEVMDAQNSMVHQSNIVKEYARPDQFITHNLDFEWRGYSYGVQPDVNHFKCAKHLTMAGTDIYHPTQDHLTGAEIAFGGDLIRCLKNDNYLVLETEAQGYPGWTPYDGQLRLQAYSHLASGALGVMYWHWHSIHNSFETYWKGLLSHDMEENAVYREACIVGDEFKKLSPVLSGLKKDNKVAIMVSNEALTALKWFGIEATAAGNSGIGYNDVVRRIYDALYKINIECDIIWEESENIEKYQAIILPAMYTADEKVLTRLKDYTAQGGTLIATFKTAFANENVKVYSDRQPHILSEVFGMYYQQFTFPEKVTLTGFEGGEPEAETFMELLIPDGAEIISAYQHPNWKKYAAVTHHTYESGNAWYIGCMFEECYLQQLLIKILAKASVNAAVPEKFPVIVREGVNEEGEKLRFYLNYSWEEQRVEVADDFEVVLGNGDSTKYEIYLSAWDVCIIKFEK